MAVSSPRRDLRPPLAWLALASLIALAGCGRRRARRVRRRRPLRQPGRPPPRRGGRRRLEHRLPDQPGGAGRISRKVDAQGQGRRQQSGTGGGFGRYLKDEVNIVNASRPAKPEEEARAKAQGHGLAPVPGRLRRDHRRRQPQERLRQGADRRAAQDALGARQQGQDLEGPRPVLARPARSSSTRPDEESGTFDFFTEAVVGKARSQRNDVQASSDDNALVRGVAGDADGLGYFGYAYYRANARPSGPSPIKKDQASPAVDARPRDDPGQDLCPALPPAVHLREEVEPCAGPASRRSSSYYLEQRRRPGHAGRSASPRPPADRRGKRGDRAIGELSPAGGPQAGDQVMVNGQWPMGEDSPGSPGPLASFDFGNWKWPVALRPSEPRTAPDRLVVATPGTASPEPPRLILP